MLTLYHNDMSVCSQKVASASPRRDCHGKTGISCCATASTSKIWYLKLNRRSWCQLLSTATR